MASHNGSISQKFAIPFFKRKMEKYQQIQINKSNISGSATINSLQLNRDPRVALNPCQILSVNTKASHLASALNCTWDRHLNSKVSGTFLVINWGRPLWLNWLFNIDFILKSTLTFTACYLLMPQKAKGQVGDYGWVLR